MPNPRRVTHSRGTSWEITYRVDGRMVRQRFATRTLAVAALARARTAALDGLGITPADGKTTLAEYAPRWLAAQQCRPSTLSMYSSHVRNHIVPMLGRRPMGTLRRTDISTFVVDLTHKQLATATVVTIYWILAMILRSAVHDRLLAASPCYKIKLPGMPHRRLQAFTADEVGALLEHAPPRDYAVLALGVGTGMRQGEMLGLTLPHLRLLARELSVEQQYRVVPGGPPEITPELKTAASRRVLPLPHFVVTALARHIQLFGVGPQQTVFFSPRGGLWRRGSFNETVWKPALDWAGLPREYGFQSAATHLRLVAHLSRPAPAGHPGPPWPQVGRRDDGHLRAPVPRRQRGDDPRPGRALQRRAAAPQPRRMTDAAVALVLIDQVGLEFWSMTTLSLSEAKARLSQIADEVHRTHERVTITKNGRSYLVLMSAEDLESIEATLELLADAEAVRRAEQGRKDLAAGLGTPADSMAELMSARREPGGD